MYPALIVGADLQGLDSQSGRKEIFRNQCNSIPDSLMQRTSPVRSHVPLTEASAHVTRANWIFSHLGLYPTKPCDQGPYTCSFQLTIFTMKRMSVSIFSTFTLLFCHQDQLFFPFVKPPCHHSFCLILTNMEFLDIEDNKNILLQNIPHRHNGSFE